MAIDEGLAHLLREDLAGETITEKKMFGGLCFILNGNMVTGTMKSSALFRVGKANDAAALAIPGAYSMIQRDKPMAGFVQLPTEDCGDDARRSTLSAMALAFAKSLPPK